MENVLPAQVAGPLAGFVDDLRDRLGDNLISVVLYGSAARGDWFDGRSDLNVMVIAKTFPPAALKAAGQAAQHWHQRIPISPIFATADYLTTSADVFPLEFLDMREAHVVLAGPDPLADLPIDPRNLRRQVEAELKGKLMRLRAAYARAAGHPRAVQDLITDSLSSFRALFQGVLRLVGQTPPSDRAEVMRSVSAVCGLNGAALQAAVDLHAGGEPADVDAVFAGYLSAVECLVAVVDQWDNA
ncbi:MAG TPA: hypothetical protein VGM37_04205 [Armatimonadota bacterium]|jgi:hypothetical protein